MAVFERRSGFFPPEVLEDVRAVGRLFRRRTKADDGTAGFAWLWVLLLVYPFTDYLFTALVDEGVSTGIAAAAFVAFDAGIIIAVLLARGDRAGARFFGALVLVL